MTPEQRRQIAEINRMSEERFGKGASKEKFAWRNQQREALGLGREKRKRGGVSGVWDRNKEVIKPLAAGVAGALGGPAAAAALGAAMGGFDRPGQSGFGFDVGRGLAGAATGAAAGAAGAGVRGLLTAAPGAGLGGLVQAGRQGVQQYTGQIPGMGRLGGGAGGAGSAMSGVQAAGGAGAGTGSGALSFLQNNAAWIGGGATAASNVLGQRSQERIAGRQAAADNEWRMAQLAEQSRRTDLENKLATDQLAVLQSREAREAEAERRESERNRRIAELLLPYYQDQFSGGLPSWTQPRTA